MSVSCINNATNQPVDSHLLHPGHTTSVRPTHSFSRLQTSAMRLMLNRELTLKAIEVAGKHA